MWTVQYLIEHSFLPFRTVARSMPTVVVQGDLEVEEHWPALLVLPKLWDFFDDLQLVGSWYVPHSNHDITVVSRIPHL